MLINFAHANGFPAASYQKLFANLSDDITTTAVEKYGHNPRYPVSNNWPHLVDELLAHVSQENHPVVAVGHSFGAVISFIAVCKQPALFSGLIMLDPPLVTSWSSWLLKIAKNFPIIDHITPAKMAIRRRKHWPLNTDIASLLAKRKLFENFDVDCLQDYVNAIAKPQGERLVLDFSAQIEANIFRNIPDNIGRYTLPKNLPTAMITGQNTDVSVQRLIAPFLKKHAMKHLIIENGGHMFPLEQPENTAKVINQLLTSWQKKRPS